MLTHVTPRGRATIGAGARARVAAPRIESPSKTERSLIALGVDPYFVDAVLGDLAEEYDLRAVRDGASVARWWYTREMLRATPYFIRNWFRSPPRYEHFRLVAVLGGLALTTLAVLVTLPPRNGPPAQLAGASDAVIVNSRAPVQLGVQVLDSAGHVLRVTGVRYQRISGAPLRMSASGRVLCAQRGDALVSASFGALSRSFLLRCRPIQRFVDWRGGLWLTVGDAAKALPVWAVGVDGTPETMLAGSATVEDSQIASLRGLRVYPKAPGGTLVYVWVGGIVDIIPITVFKRVSTSDALRPWEFVGAPLRLASGQSREWHIQPGKYFVSFRSDTVGASTLTFSTVGATCSQFGDAYNYFCVASMRATVVVSAPGGTGEAREFSGYLAVRRGS